ncbi:MAG: hypothetical protein ABI557_15030, partial [Aureliella sp.]
MPSLTELPDYSELPSRVNIENNGVNSTATMACADSLESALEKIFPTTASVKLAPAHSDTYATAHLPEPAVSP